MEKILFFHKILNLNFLLMTKSSKPGRYLLKTWIEFPSGITWPPHANFCFKEIASNRNKARGVACILSLLYTYVLSGRSSISYTCRAKVCAWFPHELSKVFLTVARSIEISIQNPRYFCLSAAGHAGFLTLWPFAKSQANPLWPTSGVVNLMWPSTWIIDSESKNIWIFL